MSSGTISQNPIRSTSPRGGAKTREPRTKQDLAVQAREQGVIEQIALKLIERRMNQQTVLWSYKPNELKSKGRKKTSEDVARRRAKLQLCKVARNRVITTMHELSRVEYDRLVPRAVDFIFANGWMEIVSEHVTLEPAKASGAARGRPQVQHRERRMIPKVTASGQAAYGRWKAVQTNHPSTGNITVIRKAVAV